MKPQVISSVIDYENPWFKVEKDTVKRPDGSVGFYYRVKKPNNFVIIVALKKNKAVLVRQYRNTIKNYTWEFPMGTIERKEKLEMAAKREFLEETGLEAESWTNLGEFLVANGHTDQKAICFLAQNIKQSNKKVKGEEGEIIDGVRMASLLECKRYDTFSTLEKMYECLKTG